MPRKIYSQKNKYIRNTKLSEQQFLAILWYYVGAVSAPVAQELMKRDSTFDVPSTKTIAKINRRLGLYIFDKIIIDLFQAMFPKIKEVINKKDKYADEILMLISESVRNVCIESLSYDKYRSVYGDSSLSFITEDLVLEMRKISNSRQGIGDDARADVALAFFRSAGRKKFFKNADEATAIATMATYLKGWLEEDPL